MDTKPKKKKPGWIRSCFGFGSQSSSRKKRKLGFGIFRVKKISWRKTKDKTTPFKTENKVVQEDDRLRSFNDRNRKKDDQTRGRIGGDILEDSSTTKCSFSRYLQNEPKYNPCESKVKKPSWEEQSKPKEETARSVGILVNQSGYNHKKRSSKDPMIGMSVIITILIIMLLCGRVCAILCTSLCFYCLPRFVETYKNNGQGNNTSIGDLVIQGVFNVLRQKKQQKLYKVS